MSDERNDPNQLMRTSWFDFKLPDELIAQTPVPDRDQSRLLVLHRLTGQLEHRCFRDLADYLCAGDVLVLNNSRVIPARLRGVNHRTGGQFEILLLSENALNDWWTMMRPGKRARIGTQIFLRDAQGAQTSVSATVIEQNAEGHRRLRFSGAQNISSSLEELGEVPLPPYITREPGQGWEQDRERYQTIFAQFPGSVAAPTAGLHFTGALLEKLRAQGVNVCFITLHVGLGTFAPVKSELISAHQMHEEHFTVPEETIRIVNEAKREGRRIIAVGTTTVRVLETLAYGSPRGQDGSPLPAGPSAASTRLFIHPPYEFRIVDALITNFHLPRSSLLMLVSAFSAPGRTYGRETILNAYAEAIRQQYRFFSYGDAMLLL